MQVDEQNAPKELHRIALGVAYHGRAYHGWQTQPDLPNIQDTLQNALKAFTKHSINVVCAGRTDTGVHAFNQVVHLDSPVARPLHAWVRGVNALLPPDIRIHWSKEVPASFHARFDATERSYLYYVYNGAVRPPAWQFSAGWEFRPLVLEPMQEAAKLLLGTHDFTAFRASECQAKSPIKQMYQAEVIQQGAFFIFKFRANAFLHHMVRNLVGSLLYVGTSRQSVDWFAQVIEGKDRRLAAPTFMPDGLYLSDVSYPDWSASDFYAQKLFGQDW